MAHTGMMKAPELSLRKQMSALKHIELSPDLPSLRLCHQALLFHPTGVLKASHVFSAGLHDFNKILVISAPTSCSVALKVNDVNSLDESPQILSPVWLVV